MEIIEEEGEKFGFLVPVSPQMTHEILKESQVSQSRENL